MRIAGGRGELTEEETRMIGFHVHVSVGDIAEGVRCIHSSIDRMRINERLDAIGKTAPAAPE
jgi:hypothetical protein